MKIPTKARYKYVNKKAFEFFISENINILPIDPFEIIKRNKWGIVKYSDIQKDMNCNLKTVIKFLQSEDGYTIYDDNVYTIAYNDLIKPSNRITFTLMHEIGHIYLKHLIDFKETKSRNGIINNIVLENEANAFARNVLSPAPLAILIKKIYIVITKKIFNISNLAIKVRLKFLETDLNINTQLEINDKIFKHFYDFIYQKKCSNCSHSFITENANFCPICGSKNLK